MSNISTKWQNSSQHEWYHQNLVLDPAAIKNYLAPLKLTPQDIFIDLGCGDGACLQYAAQINKVFAAIGVDESQEILNRVPNLPGIITIHARLQSCANLLDKEIKRLGKITKLSSRKCLHHLENQEKKRFFSDISPLCEVNSILVIEDAIYDFNSQLISQNLSRIEKEAQEFYQHKWSIIRDEFFFMIENEFPTDLHNWEQALKAGGFEIIDLERYTCFYAKIIASKTKFS